MSDAAALIPEPARIVEIYRLIHELTETGIDAKTWRERMLARLIEWLDVEMGVSYVLRISFDPNELEPGMRLYVAIGEPDAWKRFILSGDLSLDPVTPKIMSRFGTDFTAARQELLDDATWYESSHFKTVCVPSKLDQVLYSQVAIDPPGLIDGIGLVRALGKPPYSAQDVALVRFFHQELARLWRKPDPLGIHGLPARQREVVKGIRLGESRKQIAETMGVSVHTVHTYEKALFEKAGVSSRGALLAQLARNLRPTLLTLILGLMVFAFVVVRSSSPDPWTNACER